MIILCVDFGLKRIGVAIGSTKSGLAFMRKPLMNDPQLFRHIGDLILDEKVGKILVGMPFKRDRAPGDIDASLKSFVAHLSERYHLPINLIDERYTSKIATRKLHAMGLKEKDHKPFQDSLAAQVMLQDWFHDRLNT